MSDHGNIHGESSQIHLDLSAIDDVPCGQSTGDLALDPAMIQLKRILNPMDMDYTDQEGCFPGTRDKIIQAVVSSRKDIFWICGNAGSGKSALAISIVRELRRRNCPVAFFRFDRNDAAKSNPLSVVRTIAYQLALSIPRYRSILSVAALRDPVVTNSPYEDELDSLLREPLTTEGAVDPNTHIILVFDALDEWKSGTPWGGPYASERIALLLRLYSPEVPIYRIVLSRPTERLGSMFKLDAPSTYDVDLSSSENSADVSVYFKTRLERIRPQEQSIWPGDENIQKLTEMSCGSFRWASAASDFIQSSMNNFENPIEWNFGEIDKAIDPFYAKVLESAGDDHIPEFVATFRVVMGIILEARRPLWRDTIAAIMMAEQEVYRNVMATVTLLEPFLDEFPGVRIMHPSLSSFFFDFSRCHREDWYFEHSEVNHMLAIHCLEYLRSSINADVSKHSSRISQRLIDEDESCIYSCEYWVDHFCASGAKSTSIYPLVENFLQHRFLQWLQTPGFRTNKPQNIADFPLTFHLLDFVKTQATFVKDHPDRILELEPTLRNVVQLVHSHAALDMPPEPTSVSIDLVDIDDMANSAGYLRHSIPEQPPEPFSLVLGLTEVEDGMDLNESIPEIPPEPVSSSLELVEVDETPGSTTGGRDIPQHTDPEIPPEPLSIIVELTESDDVLEVLPEVLPGPAVFSIDLVDSQMGSQSPTPEMLSSPPYFSIALDEEPDQHSIPEHSGNPRSISISRSPSPV